MATFQFQYLVLSVTAKLEGGVLEVKQGLQTRSVPVEAIEHLFVNRQGSGASEAEELVVGYRAQTGKKKFIRAYANVGQPSFQALVEALVQARPQADLRAMAPREAFKLMGATDTEKVVLVVLPIVLLAGAALLAAPFLIHGLDHGSAEVSVEALGRGALPPDTRNLVISGDLDTERYLAVTHTKNGVKQSADYQFAVRPHGASRDAEVPVVLKTSELGSAGLRELARRESWRCTLRNAWWEGLASDDRAYLREELKLNVTKKTLLCELTTGRGPADLVLFFVIVGTTALVLMIVMGIMVTKRLRRSAGR